RRPLLRRRTAALERAEARWERLDRRQHAAGERIFDEGRVVLQPELAHDVRAMRLRRTHTDREPARDARAAVALGHQLQHLALAAGERLVGVAGEALGLQQPRLDVLGGERRAEIPPALRHRADGARQLVGLGLFHDVARRAVAQRLRHVPLVDIAGEHDHAGLRRAVAHLPGDLDAIQAGHRDVDDEDFGLETLDERNHGQAVRRLTDDLEIVLDLEETLDRFADHVLVVREHDPGRGPAAGAFLGFLHGVGQVHAVLRVWRTAEEIRWSAHRVYSYTYRVQRSYLRRAVDSFRELTRDFPDSVCVAMSADGDPRRRNALEFAREAGARLTLRKPIEPWVLLRTLEGVVAGRRSLTRLTAAG